uniref:Uncharacterized protein n=1 Tax=Glossina austeni TaxID=7395 RepID=A0A1A9V8B0_GLOAU
MAQNTYEAFHAQPQYHEDASMSSWLGIMTSCLKNKKASLRAMLQICSNTEERQPGNSQLSENDSKILPNSVYDLTLHYPQTKYAKCSKSRALAVKETDTIFLESASEYL